MKKQKFVLAFSDGRRKRVESGSGGVRFVDPETRESESGCVSEVQKEAWRFWFLSFCASDLLLRPQDRFSLFLSSGLSLQNAVVIWVCYSVFLKTNKKKKKKQISLQLFLLTVATVLAMTFSPTKQRIAFYGIFI